jgi:amino acid permease
MSSHSLVLIVQGFAAGWSYCISYALDYPDKAIVAANYMFFWTSYSRDKTAGFITIFLLVPIVFNFFNVRRYGEIEFWLTTIKVTTIMLLIVLGFLLAMGASPTQLLGTDANYNPVPCSENVIGQCVPPPGFVSISISIPC